MASDLTRPIITIITPVYNEAAALPEYYERVREVLLDRGAVDCRVLFVDDGSEDASWAIIRNLCERDERCTAIRLSRNFGSHIALSAGFCHARGDAVATLACDLQDPPETILQFIERWRAGAHIVWGRRRSRRDSWWRRLTSRIFFFLISRWAMPKGSNFQTGSFFLVDRIVADSVRRFQEQNRIMFALVAWTGYTQDVVDYDRQPRRHGASHWTLRRMLKAMYDTFIGFSLAPVKAITALGLFSFLVSLGVAIHVLLNWWFGDPIPGWTGIMFFVSVLMGIQFLVLGVMAEYLARIYSESVRRPLFFIEESIGVEADVPVPR